MPFDTLEATIAQWQNAAHWIPAWIVDAALLFLAILAALIVHAILSRLASRLAGGRHPYVATLVQDTKGPARLALIIFSLNAVLPAVSLTPDTAIALRHLLQVGLILLLGWIAVRAIHLASKLYLLRFQTDVADNLLARKHITQINILRRAADFLIVMVTAGAALMTFESVRQFGVSLFASAGVAGLILGLAARPVLSNLIAGIQLALTQPIRIDDAVVVEGESGNVEEINSTYVVLRLWDWRRLIVPLNYFIEKPFQNWTRDTSAQIGTVFLFLDYTAPVPRIREKLREILAASPLWDGQVANVQVTECTDRALQVRILVSARNAASAWDLRCDVRENLIAFLQKEYPDCLPRVRQQSLGKEEQKAPANRKDAVA
jgi:small-conductance mechanosensitive channel